MLYLFIFKQKTSPNKWNTFMNMDLYLEFQLQCEEICEEMVKLP